MVVYIPEMAILILILLSEVCASVIETGFAVHINTHTHTLITGRAEFQLVM